MSDFGLVSSFAIYHFI